MIKIIFNFIFLFGFTFAYTQTSNSKNNSSLNLEWKSRGPSNISGITRAILWDKDDENVLYSGGIASGLYKSIDKGANWSKVESYSDNNPSIASFAKSINGSIFVGTGFVGGSFPNGELNSYSLSGDGIFKSNDSGVSWTQIDDTKEYNYPNASSEWSYVSSMSAHPNNSNLLMIGNNAGVRISINAEASQPTFTNATGISGQVNDVQFTSDGNEAWAAANGRIYRSTDLSGNFTNFSLNSPSGFSASRAQIAISKVDNNGDYTIYASFNFSSGCLIGVFKSEDKGANWSQIASSTSSIDPFQFPGSGGCQGWYSHSLAVSPENKDIIYLGGVTLSTLTTALDLVLIDDINNENANDFLPHDKHKIVFNPSNAEEMIIGTDKGLFISKNALSNHPYDLTYSSINNGLNNSNALNADISKNGEILLSGFSDINYIDYSQSNPYFATKVFSQSNATTEISNYEENIFIFSGIYGSVKKSKDKGSTYGPFLDANIDPAGCNVITCADLSLFENCNDVIGQGAGFFNENYLFDSETNSKFFVPTRCGSNFFVCINPLSLTDIPIYNSFYIPFSSGTKTLDVSTDGDRLVLGSGSRVIVVDNFESFVPSIPNNQSSNTAQIDINTYDLSSIGIQSVSGVAIDKNNKNHIIVTEDGYGSNSKIAKTIDGGLNWQIIHNNLPEMPLFDCIIDANNSNNYIIASYYGIWSSSDAGVTWQPDYMGIGSSPIYRLRQEWVLEEDCYVLIAATVGNGVYTSTTLTNCNKDVEEEIWGEYNPINQVENQNLNFNVYPNPTKDIIQIDLESDEKNIVKVYDVFGKQVYSNTINSRLEIETNDWAPGMYYISIKNTTVKIIILK